MPTRTFTPLPFSVHPSPQTSRPSACLPTIDLAAALPGFQTQRFVRLNLSLEKNHITTADLITLDVTEIAKRAQLPLLDLKRLCNAVLETLHSSLGVSENPESISLKTTGKAVINSWDTVSTLDHDLDVALGRGISAGYVTEVTGERYGTIVSHLSSSANLMWSLVVRANPIPPHPSPLRAASSSTRSIQQCPLHLNRKRTSNDPTLPALTQSSGFDCSRPKADP